MRFNIAFALQEWATAVLREKRNAVDVKKQDMFEAAAEALEQAKSLFEHLISLGQEVTRIDVRKLQKHVEHCQKTLKDVSGAGGCCRGVGGM